eukprot:398198-Heterocapsa_arctica.AAC.1
MERIQNEKPQLPIGSPMCTPFSCIQALNWGHMEPSGNLAAGRYFLHEHPATATSWQDPKVIAFMQRPGVATT